MTSTSIGPPSPPRGIAISGLLFCLLYTASLVLIRLAVPPDSNDPGTWLTDPSARYGVQVALNLIPFAGITFLWFMAVLRNHVGLLEDRFFSTVFLGSGLLFVAMLFSAGALSTGLLVAFGSGIPPEGSKTYHMGRAAVHALMSVFAVKMSAVFVCVTSMIGLRTGVFTRWLSFTGFAIGLVLLLVFTELTWTALLFPFWVLLVSMWLLIADINQATSPAR